MRLAVIIFAAVLSDPVPPPSVGWRGTETGSSFLAMTLQQRESYVSGVFDGLLIAPFGVAPGAVASSLFEGCAQDFTAAEVANDAAERVLAGQAMRERPAAIAVWGAVTLHCRKIA